MPRPLVSILTPSFNQGVFLADCLHSVACQTYAPIEQLVADGGSTDESLSVLQAAPAHVRWISEPDGGQAEAINKAFRMSSGEIIGWLNSDDAYFCRDAVQRAADTFSHRPDIGVVVGDALLIDQNNRVLRYKASFLHSWQVFPALASPITQPAVFIRRALLDDSLPLVREDLNFAFDLELWLRLNKAGAKFHLLRRPIAVDREHPLRKTRTIPEQAIAENHILAADYGFTFRTTARTRAAAWLRRWRGVIGLVQKFRHEDPAIALSFDSPLKMLARQLLLSYSLLKISIPKDMPVKPPVPLNKSQRLGQ